MTMGPGGRASNLDRPTNRVPAVRGRRVSEERVPEAIAKGFHRSQLLKMFARFA